jgi:hypothetical protein
MGDVTPSQIETQPPTPPLFTAPTVLAEPSTLPVLAALYTPQMQAAAPIKILL